MRLDNCQRRFWSAALVLATALLALCSARGDESAPPMPTETPLHERIDALIEAAAVGPLNPPASDADFLRRVSLDLTGVIPTATEARAFLSDESPDKRAKLIEQLLASPHYARHMAQTFDVMLIERRADKAIKVTDWEEYLRLSFAANKPLDQLYRELIVADGATEPVAAARFLMNRDCEPNAVTRDLGRMYFGMDLQCAQCHDHPLVEDYFQADYYGLYAFVLRSSLFTDRAKKTTLIAEKGEGEANYKSVFTDDSADRVTPRLPKGLTVSLEPTFAKGQEYVVAPAANVRPVPKYSRRSQLAELLKESHEFRRNLANRLWAQMLGRGIVHPVDFHHPDNPPSHPELLALLADELAQRNFDARSLLREIALSRVYQRSCDAPDPAKLNLPPAADEIARLEAKRGELSAKIDERKTAVEAVVAERKEVLDQAAALQTELAALEMAAKAADEAAEKAIAAQKQADEAAVKKKEAATLVTNAALRTSVAAKKLPEDKAVAEAFKLLDERAKGLAAEGETAAKAAADMKTHTDAAVAQSTVAQEALTAARAKLPTEELNRLERALVDAQHTLADARYTLAALDAQIVTAKTIGDWQAKAGDPALAEPAFAALVDRWTVAGQIAGLKGLSCEQFARSLMQATGAFARHQATAADGLARKPTDEWKYAPDADKPRLLAELTEVRAHIAIRGELTAFAGLYGTLHGDDFQATVNQALFFGNGSMVQGWLSPAAGNLTERLMKLESPSELAEELYLAVFTRFATQDEKDEVTAFLNERSADRPAAVGELIWALVSSNEFRFNH
jgi:hypothetical protein